MPGKLRPYLTKMDTVGGRGGTRTRGPLLAKQVGKNTKCFCWCRLHGNSAKFPLFNCPEVVPKLNGTAFVASREIGRGCSAGAKLVTHLAETIALVLRWKGRDTAA